MGRNPFWSTMPKEMKIDYKTTRTIGGQPYLKERKAVVYDGIMRKKGIKKTNRHCFRIIQGDLSFFILMFLLTMLRFKFFWLFFNNHKIWFIWFARKYHNLFIVMLKSYER